LEFLFGLRSWVNENRFERFYLSGATNGSGVTNGEDDRWNQRDYRFECIETAGSIEWKIFAGTKHEPATPHDV
jgi:hypothetical protein